MTKSLLKIAFAVCSLIWGAAAYAFAPETYAERSRLASGRWVKISVASSGMHIITYSQLAEWGFPDPARVKLYGYGGARIPDHFTLSNYVDDVPPVQVLRTSRGIVFYAQGPVSWSYSSTKGHTHTVNPFSTLGYYFLSESDEPDATIPASGIPGVTSGEVTTTYTDYRLHELEINKTGETGHQLLGEDFKWTPSQTFPFTLTDIVTSEPVKITTQFVARSTTSTSTLHVAVNGTDLPYSTSDLIRKTANSSHSHGEQISTTKQTTISSPQLSVGLRLTCNGTLNAANLDFIEINYTRRLKLSGGVLRFDISSSRATLTGATAATHVWDITNPRGIISMNTRADGAGASWTNIYSGHRNYVAWNDEAPLPSPAYVCEVANQNLHDASETPEMVILALPAWRSQAEQIAQMHRTSAVEPLTVKVLDPYYIYNEFGSGVPDVNAIRRYFKMLYDRSRDSEKPFRYALIMGQPRYDNRILCPGAKAITYPTLPTWQSDYSLDDNSSYTTDDIFAFLEDNSGRTLSSDILSIAVGRIPCRNSTEAQIAVDKLKEYTTAMKRSSWRNQVLLLADDENNGVHMSQSDDMWTGMRSAPDGEQFNYTKVYIDAFEKRNGTYPDARDRMFRRIDEGLMWWNYIGHANPTSWTSEKMLTYNDINTLTNRQYPVLYAATCEFLNWDSATASGAEIMYYTKKGGIIAAITAVRPVYISDNGTLGKAFSPMIFQRDDQGRYLTIGELYRRGKNNIVSDNGQIISNSNKLRYVLMGDPAIRFATPANRVVVESINGIDAGSPEEQIVLMARQKVTIKGHIAAPDGSLLSDFNGDVSAELYDAEYSTTSRGYGEGTKYTFQEQGSRLFSGRDIVKDGRFEFTVPMPESVLNNFRPAALNFYACSSTGNGNDASGMFRDFYVFGMDTETQDDTTPPVIDTIYLNHPSFKSGDTVNPTPMLTAHFSDDTGFNLATLGVGHTFTLDVDGEILYNNLTTYFTPDLGSRSGTINYPVPELRKGNHTLRLRIWDTAGNHSEATLECFVDPDARPTIYELYCDANPATVEANFYLKHDRPDQNMTVTIEVFNLLGKPVWKASSTGRSDMYTSSPVTWNLTDGSGRRVGRGIYLYRATITEADGTSYATKTSRLAVTAQ